MGGRELVFDETMIIELDEARKKRLNGLNVAAILYQGGIERCEIGGSYGQAQYLFAGGCWHIASCIVCSPITTRQCYEQEAEKHDERWYVGLLFSLHAGILLRNARQEYAN
mgnify:CR=1 FL=1